MRTLTVRSTSGRRIDMIFFGRTGKISPPLHTNGRKFQSMVGTLGVRICRICINPTPKWVQTIRCQTHTPKRKKMPKPKAYILLQEPKYKLQIPFRITA